MKLIFLELIRLWIEQLALLLLLLSFLLPLHLLFDRVVVVVLFPISLWL